MQTSNPALMANPFSGLRVQSADDVMTINGTAQKGMILLLCVLLTSFYTWSLFFQSGNPQAVMPWMWGGLIGGFVTALVTIFKKEWSTFTAPLYALFEGLFIGAISSIFEAQFPGIVIQAAGLTFGTLAMMLFIYSSRIIQVTDKFRLGIVAATGGIALVYFVSIILGFFGINVPFIYESGLLGIGFSVFVVIIAALNLILDFDLIEKGSKLGAPKYMEWYGAFALMVTLIWLYIEILRLLSKVRSQR